MRTTHVEPKIEEVVDTPADFLHKSFPKLEGFLGEIIPKGKYLDIQQVFVPPSKKEKDKSLLLDQDSISVRFRTDLYTYTLRAGKSNKGKDSKGTLSCTVNKIILKPGEEVSDGEKMISGDMSPATWTMIKNVILQHEMCPL